MYLYCQWQGYRENSCLYSYDTCSHRRRYRSNIDPVGVSAPKAKNGQLFMFDDPSFHHEGVSSIIYTVSAEKKEKTNLAYIINIPT